VTKRKRIRYERRAWLRPKRSPGPQSTIHASVEYTRPKPDDPWHYCDASLGFRDCNNYTSFELGGALSKHIRNNIKVLCTIKAECDTMIMKLTEVAKEMEAHEATRPKRKRSRASDI